MTKRLSTLAASLLLMAGSAFAQQVTCDTSYIPKVFQDCPGAIPLCGPRYSAATDDICGEGRILNEVIGSCGTNERVSTWYRFTATTSGLLSFVVVPNDVTDTADYGLSSGQGDTDYDFVIFKLPAGAQHSLATCQLLAPTATGGPSPYEIACNYSGARGATGLDDRFDAPNQARFEAPVQVSAGDQFVLLVDNFTLTSVGYRIIFQTPADSSRYADVTSSNAFGIETITYDPSCQGNCPVLIKLSQYVDCSNLTAELIVPSSIGQNLLTSVACAQSSAQFSDSILVYGNFSPADTALQLTLIGSGSTGLYRCTNSTVFEDSTLLRPRLGYNTFTPSRDKLQAGFVVAPNPFGQSLSVTIPGAGLTRFNLYDATGKLAYTASLQGGRQHQLSLPPSLPRGFYTAELLGLGQPIRKRLARE